MASVLRELRERGFWCAPKYLGQDDQGRDVLSFIPGEVEPRWRRFEDVQVHLAGRLLREFHDATRGSALAGAAEVICHNDPGPNNVVFQNERPVALIDFDMAAPGQALEDLGYMVWSWCVASKPSRQPAHRQAAQVRVMVDAYQLSPSDRPCIVDAMLDRQRRNLGFWEARRDASAGAESLPDALQVDEILAWTRRELAYTIEHRTAFLDALA